jgi:hypothetical protein
MAKNQSVQGDEQSQADAEDDQRNEEMTVGEDALGGFKERHRVSVCPRIGWRKHTEVEFMLSTHTAPQPRAAACAALDRVLDRTLVRIP